MNSFHLIESFINLQLIVFYPHVKFDLDVLDENMADSFVELGTLQLFSVEIYKFLEIIHPWTDIVSV